MANGAGIWSTQLVHRRCATFTDVDGQGARFGGVPVSQYWRLLVDRAEDLCCERGVPSIFPSESREIIERGGNLQIFKYPETSIVFSRRTRRDFNNEPTEHTWQVITVWANSLRAQELLIDAALICGL